MEGVVQEKRKPLEFTLMLNIKEVANGFIGEIDMDGAEKQIYVAPTLFELLREVVSQKLGIAVDKHEKPPQASVTTQAVAQSSKGEALLQRRFHLWVEKYGTQYVKAEQLANLFKVKLSSISHYLGMMKQKGWVEFMQQGVRKLWRVKQDFKAGL